MTYEAGIEAAYEAVELLDLTKNTPFQIARDAVEAFLGFVDAYVPATETQRVGFVNYGVPELQELWVVPLRPKEGRVTASGHVAQPFTYERKEGT